MFEEGTDFVKHRLPVSVPPVSPNALPAVEHREGRFPGFDGVSLYYQAWLPAGRPPRAALVNLHGLGDHSGLYPNLASHFPPRGMALYAYDMRGNGRSPGQRAYLREWGEYLGDLDGFLSQSGNGTRGSLCFYWATAWEDWWCRDAKALRLRGGLMGAALGHAAAFEGRQARLEERTRALQESEQRFKQLVDVAQECIWVADDRA